jgi:adenosylhomocysteine nucleosidase
MIGIIAAMKAEIESVKNEMTERSVKIYSGIEFVSGKFKGKDVVVAQCGIGKVFAAICTQTMILLYKPDLIINTGVGGTLTSELSVGDIAISVNVVQHDMDTSPLGDPVGLISGINVVYFPADKRIYTQLERSANALNIRNCLGTIASGDQFISSNEQKSSIRDNFSAIACEMEGAAIGHVCYVNNVPFAVVRAISDSADDESNMTYTEFLSLAAERSFGVVSDFVENFELD